MNKLTAVQQKWAKKYGLTDTSLLPDIMDVVLSAFIDGYTQGEGAEKMKKEIQKEKYKVPGPHI